METIPVVDFNPILISAEEFEGSSGKTELYKSIGHQMVEALHAYGFVYLKNHGIDQKKIDKSFVASKQFFEQGIEQKLLYKYDDHSPKGYHGQGYSIKENNSVFDVRESFDWTGKMKKHQDDQLSFYEEFKELQEECKPLVKAVFKLISIGLQLDDSNYFLERSQWLDHPETPSFKTFRSLYYPAIPEHIHIPQGVLRVREHSDFDFITFLFQDSSGGLEIKTANETWIPATPISNTVIINIGDLLEAWSGGYLPATKHRVLIPSTEIKKRIARQSIAYFLHPDSNTVIQPLPSQIIGTYTFPQFKAYEHTKAKLSTVKSY